jgi:SOS-response transcriptional repressor LexA
MTDRFDPHHLPDDDALFRAAAERAGRELDPADPANERYFEWLARDARARQSPDERAETAARADAFAQRWAVRLQAARLRVALAPGAPEFSIGADSASVRQSVHDGRRTGRVPTFDVRAAAGVGREIWEEACDRWIERPGELPAGDYLALRVSGDSMTPLLHDGDTIVLRLGADAAPDTVVVARLPDDGYVVKKVARADRDFLELESLNSSYAPRSVARHEATVLGTVVMRWCAHEA